MSVFLVLVQIINPQLCQGLKLAYEDLVGTIGSTHWTGNFNMARYCNIANDQLSTMQSISGTITTTITLEPFYEYAIIMDVTFGASTNATTFTVNALVNTVSYQNISEFLYIPTGGTRKNTYCTHSTIEDEQQQIYIKNTLSSNQLVLSLQFTQTPNTGIIGFKNLLVYTKKCSQFCLSCTQYNCNSCQAGFIISLGGNGCVCLNFMQGSNCVTNCLSTERYQEGKCLTPISSPQVVIQDYFANSFSLINFIPIIDPIHSVEKSYVSVVDLLSMVGPFYYNEGFNYTVQIPSNQQINLQFTLYVFGTVQIYTRISIFFNNIIIASLKYLDKWTINTGKIISSSSCTSSVNPICNQYNIILYYQTIEIINSFSFKGAFNVLNNSQGWGIRNLLLEKLQFASSPQLATSCVTPQVLLNGACISQCPSYTNQVGQVCNDISIIYTYPKYLIKSFYDYQTFEDSNSIAGLSMQTNQNIYQTFYLSRLMFGGINYWRDQQYSNIVDVMQPHYSVTIQFKILMIDMNINDIFQLGVDNVFQTFTNVQFVLQSNVIGQSLNEYQLVYSQTQSHTNQQLTISMRCSGQGCGLYDYFVFIGLCAPYCLQCSGPLQSDCTSFQKTSANIGNFCNIGYHMDSSNTCQKCMNGCLQCTSADICSQCDTQFQQIAGKCICFNGLQVATSQCKGYGCFPTCESCDSSASCTTCSSSRNMQLKINQCICIDGYYMKSFKCHQCTPTCKTCKNSARQCLSCYPSQYRKVNYQACECQEGYFEENQQQECKKCNPLCKTCSMISTICTSCSLQLCRELNNYKCICMQGYYEAGQLSCIQCSQTCKTCIDNSSNCLSCFTLQNRELDINGGSCICSQGYYDNNTETCQQCFYKCLSCNKANQDGCNRCPLSRFQLTPTVNFECKCKPGYFETNEQECLECKTIQNPSSSHPCYSSCGDGIIQWNEECDDGNINPRDNCNNCYLIGSICLTELCISCYANQCVKCKDGYFLKQDGTCQQCDQSCTTCLGEADSCTQCALPNCQKCSIEEGWIVVGDKCVTVCGDGIKAGNEQCDDLNNNNGDGCSSQCTIEEGYSCQNTCITKSYPTFYLEGNKFDRIYDPIRHIRIYSDDYLTIKAPILDFAVIGVYGVYNNLTVIDRSSKNHLEAQIIVNLLNSSDSATLNVYILPNLIIDKNGNSFLNQHKTIQLKKYIKVSDQIVNQTNILINLTLYLLYVILGLALASFLFGGLNIYYNTLDFLQEISYLYFINVEYPYNVEKYLQIFKFALLTQLQELFDFDTDYIPLPDFKFQEVYSSAFIINSFSFWILLFGIIVTYFLTYVTYETMKKSAKQITQDHLDDKEYSLFNYFLFKIIRTSEITLYNFFIQYPSGMIRIAIILAFNFNISIFLQIKNFDYQPVLVVSSIISILALFIEIYLLYIGFQYLNYPHYLMLKSTKNNMGSLYEGLGIQNYKQFYNLLNISKKALYIMFLVLLYDNSSIQILMVTLLNIILIIYTIRVRPFEDQLEFYKNLISLVLIWFIEFILVLYTQDFNYDQQIYIGWAFMCLCIFLILLQLMFNLKQQADFLTTEYAIIRRMMNKIASYLNKQQFQSQPFIKSPSSKQSIARFKVRKFVTFTINDTKQDLIKTETKHSIFSSRNYINQQTRQSIFTSHDYMHQFTQHQSES